MIFFCPLLDNINKGALFGTNEVKKSEYAMLPVAAISVCDVLAVSKYRSNLE